MMCQNDGIKMLSKIVQSLRVWVRRLWRRRTRLAKKKVNLYPFPKPQVPPRESLEVPQKLVPPAKCKQRNLDTDSLESDHTRGAEFANAGKNNQSDQIPTEIERITPVSDSLKKVLSEDDARAENSDSPEGKRKKRNQSQRLPRKIGGRRNRPAQAPPPANDDARNKPTFTPRPELICRRSPGSWQWEVVLFAEEECNIVKILRDGDPLDIVNGEYSLSSLNGSLSIDYKDKDRESEKLSLFDVAPLIFKLRNDWKGNGRKVRGITSGYFIVLVPKDWKRRGGAPVEPEECTDANFMAHYFYVKKGESPGNIGGFEGHGLTLTKTGFELVGHRVFDDCEDGELFGVSPPELKPASGVVWARVGEEREGGWKGENFKPAEQSLADVLNGRQGRFFVRVYDDGAKLLDHGELRYLRELREIRVNDEPYSANTLLVPPSAGHSPAEVQFVGTDGTAIQPKLGTAETYAAVQSRGILIVAPHPAGDCISCALQLGADRVDTVIKLPRIWWRMEQDGGGIDEWRDIPLAMTQQELRERSDADAVIRLRLPLRVPPVKVGFDEERDRTYRPQKNGDDTEAEIRLSDFVDYDQINQRLNKDALLNVQCGAKVMALIRVSADPVPMITTFTSKPTVIKTGETATLHWATQSAKAGSVAIDAGIGSVESSGSITVEPAETTTYALTLTVSGMADVTQTVTVKVHAQLQHERKLSARVKRRGGGWRWGRGFSRGELHAAGLTVADVLRWSIPVDMHRRSTHQVNIDTIRESMDG